VCLIDSTTNAGLVVVCLIDSTSNAELIILYNDYNVFYNVGMHCRF
jgi:hypothetical protein